MYYLKRFFFVFLTFMWLSIAAQNHFIKGKVTGILNNLVYLSSYSGDKTMIVDSANINSSGIFCFNLKSSLQPGLFKISLGKSLKDEFYGGNGQDNFLNLIYNNENIEFTTNIVNPIDSIRIIESKENQLYFKFMERDKQLNLQMELLIQMKNNFPKTDKLYPSLKNRYDELQQEHKNYTLSMIEKNPGTYISHIIKVFNYTKLDFDLPANARSQYMIDHYFDPIDFSDTLLLHSDVYTSKTMAYLKFVSKFEMMKNKNQTDIYIKIVDKLMTASQINDKVNKQIRDFLIHGFEIMHNDAVLTHIYETYVKENTCSDDNQVSGLKRRVDGAKLLATGNKAPEITFIGTSSQTTKLSQINTAKTVVIFWASWCPHCRQTLPELKKMYDGQQEKKFEVVAVSIDTNKTSYDQVVQEGKFNWINQCDLKGWNGIAGDYFVYETPTLFLLDREKKIIAKPLSLDELNSMLK